ncbi:protein lin-37 homolog isoform X3 [Cloeon dipterum]|uniref:protein lin-37 homolog isoform X3 n=1 Tax=Cloeon dipterum TaxID=197152 RepID=UPI00321FBE30
MPPKRRSVKTKSKDEEEPTEMILPDGETEAEAEAEVAAAVDHLLFTPEKEAVEEVASSAQPVSMASLSMARSRLTTLLSKIHREEADHETARSSPLADIHAGDDAFKIKSESVAVPSKKRRRREVLETGGPHHSYVMKLFDRSVDLAQFNEKTALYPVCRAWMANRPRHVPKPIPPDSDEEYDYLELGSEELGSIVRKMPPAEAKTEAHNRVPHKLPVKSNNDTIVKQLLDTCLQEDCDESLLEEHKQHWRQVKRDWVQAAFNNETRYGKSIKMIEDIYKRAQELYS